MKKGIQDILVTLFSRGSSMAIALGTQSALAWLLGKEGRGEYAVCLVFTSLSVVILTFGMDWAANYSIASKKLTLSESTTFSGFYIFAVCFIGCPLVYLLTLWPVDFFQKAPPEAFRLSIFWIAASMMFNFNSAQLRGLREFNFLAAATISQSLFILVGTIVGIKILGMDVLAPIAAGITGSILFCIVTLIWLKSRYALSWAFPAWQKIRQELHYGLRTFWGTLGMQVNIQIGTILLAFFVSEGQIGLFAVAMGLLSQIGNVSDVVGSVVQPRVSACEKGRPELVMLCCRIVIMLSIIACLFILVFSRPLVATLFSAEFLPVIPLLFILTPGIIIRCAGKSLFPYFNGINRPGVVSVATILNLAVNILLLVILLPKWGLPGAAWATTSGYVVSSLYLFVAFISFSKMSIWKMLLIQTSDFRLVGSSFVKREKMI
jgi:O-antigen/teichoic acid export membrane protein